MIDLKDYGYKDSGLPGEDGLLPARIIEIRRERYKAICMHGEVAAALTGSFVHRAADRGDYPSVGDFVLLRYNEQGDSGITRLLPRFSKFSRTDFSGHAAGFVKTILEQVVAANFDYVFILSSLNQDFSAGRIARYLTQARQSGGRPVVVLTKADLCGDVEGPVEALRDAAGDIDVIPISAHTGFGLRRLEPYVQPGKTIVFLGMSGVGKSSLFNALAGEERMAVSEIRQADARGRHTTTHRQLVRLQSGAMIIDTPGMRELGLWEAEEGIRASFCDIEDLTAACRFSDCRHETEPGCAVQAALEDGSLTEKRWRSYLSQKQEAAFVRHKSKTPVKKRKGRSYERD